MAAEARLQATHLRLTRDIGTPRRGQGTGCAAYHSRARRSASLRSAGVIRSATASRVVTTRSRCSPDDREAARFNHIWASTLSCGTPSPVAYITPRANCAQGVALLGGAAVPGDRFNVILRDAFAGGVPHPEGELRAGVALFGGAAVPADRFNVILRDAFAGGVHHPEGELRQGFTLLGGATVPGDRFDVVLWDAFAGGVPQPEGELRLGLARFGAGAQVGKFLCCRFVLSLDRLTEHREAEGTDRDGG